MRPATFTEYSSDTNLNGIVECLLCSKDSEESSEELKDNNLESKSVDKANLSTEKILEQGKSGCDVT